TLLVPHRLPLIAYCEDGDAVTHRLFRLTEPERIAAVSKSVAAAPVVLADGHHRFETACAYRDERLAAGIDDVGAGRIMAFAAELADDELSVRPIHRLLHGVEGVDVRGALTGRFSVVEAGPNTPDGIASLRRRMRDEGGLGLVDRSGLALLPPAPPARGEPPGLPGLDPTPLPTHPPPAPPAPPRPP